MSLLADAAADVATFFDPAVGFGVPALFMRVGESTSNAINVSFDKAFSTSDVGAEVEASQDQCSFATADWPDAKEGDKISITGTPYVFRILDAQPDGLGVTICTLTEDE